MRARNDMGRHQAVTDPLASVGSRPHGRVHRSGFATTQEAYDEAFDSLFRSLDGLERRLASSRYLVGDAITEADCSACRNASV